MEVYNKIKNFIIYGLGQSVNILIPLLAMPYIIKICGEDGLGKIGIAFSLMLILCGLVDYSSYLVGTREIVLNKRDSSFLRQQISAIYSYKVLLFVILSLLAIIFVNILPFYEENTLIFLSLFMVLSQLLNPNWIFQAFEEFEKIALYNVLSKLGYLIMIFVFLHKDSDYIWVNFFFGISGTLVYLYAFLRIYKRHQLKFDHKSFQNGIEILKRDFRICLSEFCLSLYQYLPIMIVGALLGNTLAGLYRVAEQVFSVFRTFIFMFFTFSYPIVVHETAKKLVSGIKIWLAYHFVHLIIILIGTALVFIFTENILIYFKINQNSLPQMINILKLMLFVPLLLVLSQALRQLMFAMNFTKSYTLIIYFATVIHILMMILFIQAFDIEGAFYSMIAVEAIVILLYLVRLNKNLKNQTI
ncbi:MAG: oligosaccharide flippase family protein [Flavobacteriaceae bacterium]|nr:oligosaccharide flippase family protein [Flavobacteriaceae bacterium]